MISKAYHTNLEEKYYDSRIKENTPNDSLYQNLSDQLMNNAHRYFEEKVLDFINDHSEGGTILDYGCGIGEKSLEYFLTCVSQNNPIPMNQFKSSIETNRFLINLKTSKP